LSPIGPDAKRLIEDNVEMARSAAWQKCKTTPATVTFDQLFSDACLGLMDAATKWSPARGVRFGTYARKRIEGAMKDGLRNRDWAPRGVRSKAERVFVQLFERPVTVKSEEDGEEYTISPRDTHAPSPEAQTARMEARDEIARLARGLRTEQKLFVALYYLLEMTLAEAGEFCNLSEARMCQVSAEVLAHLKDAAERRRNA